MVREPGPAAVPLRPGEVLVRALDNQVHTKSPVLTIVSDDYRNVGFLRYFHLAQVPNFLVSAPLYALLLYTHLHLLPPSLGSLLPSLSLPRPRRPSTHAERLLSRPEMVPYLLHSVILSGILFWASHVQIVLRLAQTMPVVWWGAAALVSRREGEAERTQDVSGRDRAEQVLSDVKTTVEPVEEAEKSLRRRRGEGAKIGTNPSDQPQAIETEARRMHAYGRWYLGWVVTWGAIATVLWAGFYPPA